MKKTVLFFGSTLAVMWIFAGCESVPPEVERGPHGTIAYYVPVQASEPGVRIETNRALAGTAPMMLKIFGDKDGTFHDFGSYFYVIQAFPGQTNEFIQTRVYRTGRRFSPEDYIPHQIYFDMRQPPPAHILPPLYAYPPPIYYGPDIYYGRPYFYWHGRYYRRW